MLCGVCGCQAPAASAIPTHAVGTTTSARSGTSPPYMHTAPFRKTCHHQRSQARQKWHITLDRSFPATVNLRNEAMMKEAGEFATHLRRCEKDIRTLKNATEGAAECAVV